MVVDCISIAPAFRLGTDMTKLYILGFNPNTGKTSQKLINYI
jgi:hypothetical protein